MFPSDFRSWVTYVAITILLAIVGNAFWEMVFRPVSLNGGRLLLRVVTLGLSSVRSKMYREVAARTTVKPILTLLFLLCCVSAGAFGWAVSDYQITHFDEPSYKSYASYEEHIRSFSAEQLKEEKASNDRKIYAMEGELAGMRLIAALILLVFSFSSYIKQKYVLAAIRYFDQLMEICGPALSKKDFLILRSRFAMVQSSQDFRAIIDELLQVSLQIEGAVVGRFAVL